jgi:hypothetical protein
VAEQPAARGLPYSLLTDDWGGEAVHTESYEQDGIQYVLSVYGVDGSYLARWTCTSCDQSGGLLMPSPTVAYAVDRVKGQAFTDHHAHHHKV